jgi:hypothetical protein
MRPSLAAAVLICAVCSLASADPLSQLSGRVIDSQLGTPVESATVLVAGPTGVEHTLTTDAAGRFRTAVKPGSYILVFVYGSARSSTRIVVGDSPATVDGKVDSTEGETIVIKDRIRPPVPPKATNHKPMKAPPYSDKALLQDAWTKAWLLLDIDQTGKLLRMKWLKKPGYDLEQIAISEIKKLKFEPARDSSGRAIRAFIVWGIEWPSAWWLDKFVGTRSGMPPLVGFPPRRKDDYVPCKGSGPWHMGSLHKTYKDCSVPNLKDAAKADWFLP